MTLLELLRSGNYRTDKETVHSYGEFYERLFRRLKDKPIRLLEIGIKFGGSLLLWHDYFPKAEIVGIDINLNRISNDVFLRERITVLHGDGYMESIITSLGTFDIIIDDGKHSYNTQFQAINLYPRQLKDGGVLIIEDVPYLGDLHKAVPEGFTYETYDFRKVKDRFDDFLFVVRKNRPIFLN